MKYIGIDVHKKRCLACITDEHGSIVEERAFDNTTDGITEFVSSLNDCKVVMESTANLWISLYEALESNGIDAVLAKPKQDKSYSRGKD